MVGTRVYLGGLSHSVSERDIDKFFKGFSGVGDIVMKNGFAFVEFDDHREAEDAIYEMNDKELLGARVTVEKARGTPRNSRFPRGGGGGFGDRGFNDRGRGGDRMQMGRRMNNNYNNNNQRNNRFEMPSRTKYRLTVTNISSKVSWQDLKDFMRQAGEVTYADAHKLRKNEGVVEFATQSDMRNALIKFDGKDLCGRRIRLNDESGGGSSSRRSRSASRSRSRTPNSRSKSRSQSRSRSRSQSQGRSRYRSKSRSVSRSRSRTPRRSSRGRSEERNNRSRSRSPLPSRNDRDRESDNE